MKKQIRELKALIDEPFTGSEEELKLVIANFQRDQEKKKHELQELENKKSNLERQLKKLLDKRTSETARLGAYEFEEKQYKSNLHRRQQYLDESSDSQSFDQRLRTENKQLLDKRLFYQEKESTLQHDLDKDKEQRIKFESTIKLKTTQVEKTLKEIQDIKQQQKQIEQYFKQLNDLNKRIENKEVEYQQKTQMGVQIDELKLQINSDEQKRVEYQFQLKDLNDQIDKLHINSKINTEYEMFQKDKSERDEQIRKMYVLSFSSFIFTFLPFSKVRHHEILTNLFRDGLPDDDSKIYPQFESLHRQLQNQRIQLERKIQDIRRDLSGKEEKRRLLADEYKRKDSQRNDYTDRLQEQLNGQIYEEYLEKLSNDVKLKQDEKGNLVGMEKTYQKFVNQLRSTLNNDP